MPEHLPTLLLIAGSAALASPIGGLVALWRTPTTLFMSMALGLAGGTLLATIAFEMLPQSLEMASWPVAASGFIAGFVLIYGFDLFVHRGKLAGEKADEFGTVEGFYRRKRPRGDEVTVLAGGTSVEELIEGLSIGVGTAVNPKLGVMVGLAIVIDNFSEGLGIAEIIRGDKNAKVPPAPRILRWTGVIGAALLVSTIVGWVFLRDLPQSVLGFLLAAGGSGMFYLTVTDLIPQAEERHYQQAGAVAAAAGFLIVFLLSSTS